MTRRAVVASAMSTSSTNADGVVAPARADSATLSPLTLTVDGSSPDDEHAATRTATMSSAADGHPQRRSSRGSSTSRNLLLSPVERPAK